MKDSHDWGKKRRKKKEREKARGMGYGAIRQLEFINIQEKYVKDEQKNLKREMLRDRRKSSGSSQCLWS